MGADENNQLKHEKENSTFTDNFELKYSLINMGKKLIKDRKFEEAIGFYNVLLENELFVNDYHPYYKLAKCYHETKRYDEEVETIVKFFKSGIYCRKRILDSFKQDLKKLGNLGFFDYSLFEELNNAYETNGALNKDISDKPVPKAIKIIKLKENNEILVEDETKFDLSDEIDDNSDMKKEIQTLSPNSKYRMKNKHARKNFKKAEDYFSNQDYENALKYFDLCIDLNPFYFEALNKKACIFIRELKYENAVDLFNQSIKISTNNYDAYLGKAYALSKLFEIHGENLSIKELDMEFLDISKTFDKAGELNKDALFFKGKFLNKIQYFDLALDCLNSFLIDASDKNEKYFEAVLEKAFSLKNIGEFDDAIEYYNMLLNNGFNSLEVFLSLGELYFILSKYDESLEMINEFLSKGGCDINALMYKALSSINLHKFDSALECYDLMFKIDNTFYDSLLFKFELLCKLHRYNDALDCFYQIPLEFIDDCYIKLKWHAEKQLHNDVLTDYYSVSYDENSGFHYQYFYIWKGEFRLFKSSDLPYLERKIIEMGQIWALLD